ncbi:MAG: sensor histidine kinase [Clostridia bacterium]|nr:sensor histidine kinase [Clostridia bacterium]MBR5746664.1 sensor histidine kinase [Clostridia bacterium]
MKELSLNILDIAQNSVKAGAKNIFISLAEEDGRLTFKITDDGCGMSADFLAKVLDPFTTTRTTRKVGLGLPLLKMAAEATGGTLEITSRDSAVCADHGTEVTATFFTRHIDCPPLGDIVSTVVLLLQNAPFEPRYVYTHSKGENVFSLDTDELHEQLGPDIPLSEPAVLEFIESYLREGEEGLE